MSEEITGNLFVEIPLSFVRPNSNHCFHDAFCLFVLFCVWCVGWLVGVLGYWEVTGNLRSGIPP